MKFSFAKAAAAATIAATAFFLVPTAAQASTYTPTTDASVTVATVAPGGTTTFQVAPGTFEGNSTVTIFLTGENASGASLAALKFAVSTANLGSAGTNGAGAVSAKIQLPSNASGSYSVTASGPAADGSGTTTSTASFSISGSGAGAAGGLPATGLDSGSLLGIWIGGGALLLVGGGLAVAGTVRRNRKQAA